MQVTAHVHRYHIDEDSSPFGAMHPGGSNIYFVGNPASRMVIIDTGEHYRDWTKGILDYYEELGRPEISAILITHGHFDHIGGVDRIQERVGAPVRCHPKLTPRLERMLEPGIVQKIESEEVIPVDNGVNLLALYTPGHEDDHICYYLEADNVMFTGDTVLGSSTTSVRSLGEYMKSLEVLLSYNPEKVFPAHGNLVDNGIERIRMFLSHRQGREEQILKALSKGIEDVYDIVDDVYPKDLNQNLREAAARNVRTHVAKLVNEGRVVEISPKYSMKIAD